MKKLIFLSILLCLVVSDQAQAWLGNYQYRRKITFATLTTGPQTDFPVLVTETNLDTAFFSRVALGAQDIAFTDETGDTELNREIVIFDRPNHLFEAWIKVPTLSSTASIYIYYGDSSATKSALERQTWSNGFAGVWHTQNTSTSISDSSLNINNGTASNTLPEPTGRIHMSQYFNTTRTAYVTMGNPSSLDIHGTNSLTIETWVRFSSMATNTYQDYISKGDYQYVLQKNGRSSSNNNHLIFCVYDTWWRVAESTFDAVNNTWYHTVGRFDADTGAVSILINGTINNTSADSATSINQNAAPLYFGQNFDAANRYLNGNLDEIRIHSVARSNSWIQTSYNNQQSPGTFCQVETETLKPTPTPTITRTFTITPTSTITPTATATPTRTASPTRTYTPTNTATPTGTYTATSTYTPTYTATPTASPTYTTTPTDTATMTPSKTLTATITLTCTISPTSTATPTITPTQGSMNDLSQVVVFPNPFRSDTSLNQRVTFSRLTFQATIRIYSLSGELVQVLEKNYSGINLSWDLTNRQGNPVASGVYVYIIKAPEGSVRGKVVLMR